MKKNLSRLIGCFLVVMFCFDAARSQNDAIRPENVKIASPNAASLGKVADIPVSFYTGIPNIEIPIHDYVAGPLKVSIGLSYHAGGLRVNEQSSWVGAGWSLNCGGMITRTVKGQPDEVVNTSSSTSILKNHGFQNYLFIDDHSFDPTALQPPYPPVIQNYYDIGGGSLDAEPDLFTFNFNGYSGKFYFRPDSTVVMAPQQDIVVEPQMCSNCSTNLDYLQGWIVTTPDGAKYYFGRTPSTTDVDPVEYSNTYSATSGLNYARVYSSWFLYKIVSPDAKFVINFSYDSETYSFYAPSYFPLAYGYEGTSNGYDLVKTILVGIRLNSITSTSSGTATPNTVNFVASSTARLDLSSGQINLNDFDFTPAADNAKSLARIDVSDGSLCKSFDFDYGYFYDNTHSLNGPWAGYQGSFNLHTDKYRLKLNSITERSCNSSVVKPPHMFSYYDEASVPRTLSLAQDHWGFFNGATTNATLLPTLSINGGWTNFRGSANRNSSWPAMRAGALQKITYPTGGFSRIVYGNHVARVQTTTMDSILVADKEISGSNNDSPPAFFSIPQTRVFKVLLGYTNSNVGVGHYTIKDSVTNAIVTPTTIGSASTTISGINYSITIFSLPVGHYKFYVTSTYSDSYHSTRGILYKFNPQITSPTDVVVGGLRVDSLISNDGVTGNLSIQKFAYDTAGVSQGIIFSRIAYIAPAYNQQIVEQHGIPFGTDMSSFLYPDGCPTAGTNQKSFYYSGSPFLPMRNAQGNHIGYAQVRVTQADGGFTIYKYGVLPGTVPADVCKRIIDATVCDQTQTYPPPPLPFDFAQDELSEKTVYGAGGNKLNKKIYSSVWNYEYMGTAGIAMARIGQMSMGTPYTLKTAKKTKLTEEEYVYDPTTSSLRIHKKTETFFGSTNHCSPTRVVTTDLNNGQIISDVRTLYSKDITMSGCTMTNTYDVDLFNNVVSRNISYQSSLGACSNDTCRYRRWLEMKYDVNQLWKADTQNRMTFNLNLKTCVNSSTLWNAANADLKALIKLRNRNQIVPVEMSRWRGSSLLESAFLTYGLTDDYYPVKYETVRLATPSATFAPFTNTSSALTKDSRYGLEETYVFAGGKMVSHTAKDGVPSSYIWNPLQMYLIAEVKNAGNGTAAYTSFEEAANEGGWSYTFSNYTTDFKTGVKAHSLSGNDVSRTGLNSATTYIISYWAKGGVPTLTNGVVSSNDASSAEADGWKYYEKVFTGATAVIISGGAGVYIDELRMYPQGALMTSYTYKPAMGIISSTDANNRHSYFDYDGLGRLWLMRDAGRSIQKQFKYNYRTTVSGQ